MTPDLPSLQSLCVNTLLFHPVVQAFKRGPDAEQVFFVELMYERCKDVFMRLGIQQLPYAFHWGPEAVAKEGRSIKISKASEVGAATATLGQGGALQHRWGLLALPCCPTLAAANVHRMLAAAGLQGQPLYMYTA